MKILIYGSDTVASLLATLLTHTFKHDITFITNTANRSNVLSFSIENSATGNTQIINAASPTVDIPDCDNQIFNQSFEKNTSHCHRYDLVILTVRPADTENAIQKIVPYLAADGLLLSIQTGVENYTTIAKYLNCKQILIGVPHIGTTLVVNGNISLHSGSSITLGQPNNTITSTDISKVYDLFSNTYEFTGALKPIISNNIYTEVWQKLMNDIAYSPLSGLLDASHGRLAGNLLSKDIILNICNEVSNVAMSSGIFIAKDDIANILNISDSKDLSIPPFLQDIKNNITPDINGIFNDLISSTVPTPTIDLIYSLVQLKYGGWFHTFPRLAADVLVVNNDKVLLIERKNPPYGWAIPGGFADYGEPIEATATRELEEETGIKVTKEQLNLLDVYSDPARDSRGHIATVVYFVHGDWDAKAADDAMDAKYFSFDNLPDLAFDHDQVINDYKRRFHTIESDFKL